MYRGGSAGSADVVVGVPKTKIDPANPCNPGTIGHAYGGCKPCNKYNPERPDDSCKHAETCSFCHHMEHERPKHRGQRGRHALQRRQFLEARDTMPKGLVSIITDIYKTPHDTMDEMKRLMKEKIGNNPAGYEAQVNFLVGRIAELGDKVQNLRPDNVRVRRARGEQAAPTPVDLESRCKWYTGTLHLMVRKMYEDPKKEDEKLEAIRILVEDSLNEFKSLKQELENSLDSMAKPDGLQESLQKVRKAVGLNEWLANDLGKLVQNERQDAGFEEAWKELQEELSFMLEVNDEKSRDSMCRATSLKSLCETVKQVVEKQKEDLFGADLEEDDSS
mmetsp:Transcript_23525/g.54619  ORF Transcript_23525/g.54619 Transcript_23525/m.54619 type:complete len:333 (-) Transcript_23525:111-1109(-)